MIPVPEKFIPRWIREKPIARWLVFIALSVAFIGVLIVQYRNFVDDLARGPNLQYHDVANARELFDSVAIGLDKYKIEHGTYPRVNGKYFFDSIKHYLRVSDVYVYADSVDTSGSVILINKRVGKKFAYQKVPRTFLGVGRAQHTIIYEYIFPDSYLLYSIGENEIDEHGEGDDMTYEGKH